LTDEKDTVTLDEAVERLSGFVTSEIAAANARRDAVVAESF